MENEKKSIHEILKAAFDEIKENHNVRIKSVNFELLSAMSGGVEVAKINLHAEVIK